MSHFTHCTTCSSHHNTLRSFGLYVEKVSSPGRRHIAVLRVLTARRPATPRTNSSDTTARTRASRKRDATPSPGQPGFAKVNTARARSICAPAPSRHCARRVNRTRPTLAPKIPLGGARPLGGAAGGVFCRARSPGGQLILVTALETAGTFYGTHAQTRPLPPVLGLSHRQIFLTLASKF